MLADVTTWRATLAPGLKARRVMADELHTIAEALETQVFRRITLSAPAVFWLEQRAQRRPGFGIKLGMNSRQAFAARASMSTTQRTCSRNCCAAAREVPTCWTGKPISRERHAVVILLRVPGRSPNWAHSPTIRSCVIDWSWSWVPSTGR